MKIIVVGNSWTTKEELENDFQRSCSGSFGMKKEIDC